MKILFEVEFKIKLSHLFENSDRRRQNNIHFQL